MQGVRAMRIAAPVFGSRIAPNFTHCSQLVVGSLQQGAIVELRNLDVQGIGDEPRIRLLRDRGVGVLVCGGIEHDLLTELRCLGIDVIDNVAGELEEVLTRLAQGSLRPGYGILYRPGSLTEPSALGPGGQSAKGSALVTDPQGFSGSTSSVFDCVACASRDCLSGRACRSRIQLGGTDPLSPELHQMTTVALDISAEPERVLCRIAELIYFCIEMHYKHVGLAFCADLFAESETVTHLLRRFMRVTPVCCRLGGAWEPQVNPDLDPTCNPVGMAHVLNEARTELNVAVGLSMGCDVVFGQLSRAPVTTLFVKDKLLANNPVSACHSRYVLERILGPP